MVLPRQKASLTNGAPSVKSAAGARAEILPRGLAKTKCANLGGVVVPSPKLDAGEGFGEVVPALEGVHRRYIDVGTGDGPDVLVGLALNVGEKGENSDGGGDAGLANISLNFTFASEWV
ncbi:hypothetical protein M407DRAFT_246873, partial [Tulasnella calospora MUT 4182]